MNQKAKTVIVISIVLLLVLGLFNAVAFLLGSTFDGNFWCGYVIVTISWLCLLIVSLLSAFERRAEDGYRLNIPSIIVSLIHFVVQLILAVITMSIKMINTKFSIAASLIIFVIYLIIIISLEIYKSKSRK